MLGAIIGDIIGSRFEFENRLSTDFELFTSDCAFTDDTVCTIATADALLKNIPFEKSLRHWCRKYPNPKGSYGGSFRIWIHSPDPKPYHSFGNGSAMRVSPCGRWSKDRETVLKYARMSAECTHNHPEGIKGAMAIADCIYQAGQSYGSKEMIRNLASDEYGYDLNMTCDSIRRTNKFNETCQVTVPQAIVCFLESHDFENAVRLAVSVGGDSDTIAAMTGSIAEAFYGNIPKDILTTALTYLPNEMLDVVYDFYRFLNITI